MFSAYSGFPGHGQIKELLAVAESGIAPILIKQINEINREIQILRERQGRIINMFHNLAGNAPVVKTQI
jgi:hypothetical protein